MKTFICSDERVSGLRSARQGVFLRFADSVADMPTFALLFAAGSFRSPPEYGSTDNFTSEIASVRPFPYPLHFAGRKPGRGLFSPYISISLRSTTATTAERRNPPGLFDMRADVFSCFVFPRRHQTPASRDGAACRRKFDDLPSKRLPSLAITL